jgi:hypothetical protein
MKKRIIIYRVIWYGSEIFHSTNELIAGAYKSNLKPGSATVKKGWKKVD